MRQNYLSQDGQNLFLRATDDAKAALDLGIVYNRPHFAVPWYGKQWNMWTSEDVQGLKQHCKELLELKNQEHVDGYILFLNQFCKVPLNVLQV